MPPLPVISNVYRCALLWVHSSGQRAVNVMHIYAPGKTADDVATILDNRASSGLFACNSQNGHVDKIAITKLDGTSATRLFTPATPGHWTGGTGGDMIPGYAVDASLRTAERGRSRRGRLYLPWVPESVQVNGTITSSDLPTQQSAWSTFRANMAADGASLAVASYKLDDQRLVSDVVLRSTCAVQRRRQARV